MAFKSLLLISLLVAAMAASAPCADAQLGLLNGILGLIHIQGTVRCSVNANTTAPVFPNALVQLQCGSGNVVSSATTNGSGLFSIVLDPLQVVLSTLLTSCNLVVKTPLAACDATLPSVGGLVSTLESLGTTLLGLLNVSNLIPTGFLFSN